MNELVTQDQINVLETARSTYENIRVLVTRHTNGSSGEPMTDVEFADRLDKAIAAAPAVRGRLAASLRPADARDVENGLLKITAARPRAVKAVQAGSAEEILNAVWGRLFSEEILVLGPSAAAVEMACREIYLDDNKWSSDKLPNIGEVAAAVKDAMHKIEFSMQWIDLLPAMRKRVGDKIAEAERLEQIRANKGE